MADEVRVGSMVISDGDRTFTKEFPERGKFAIRIPLPFERVYIPGAMVRATPGGSVAALPPMDQEYLRKIVTLNTVVLEGPSWWTSADQCPDERLLQDVWVWYSECETEFAGKLKKNQFTKAVGTRPAIKGSGPREGA